MATAPAVELHIASFVAQHRRDAAPAIAAKIRESGDMELARAGESRSIVLCECENQYAILGRIDELRAITGVLNVLLVYHHAEPHEAWSADASRSRFRSRAMTTGREFIRTTAVATAAVAAGMSPTTGTATTSSRRRSRLGATSATNAMSFRPTRRCWWPPPSRTSTRCGLRPNRKERSDAAAPPRSPAPVLAHAALAQRALQPGVPGRGRLRRRHRVLGGFNTALEATNTGKFCTGCHEMHDNVYQELKATIHYTNRSGVRATCPDCHVPHDWTDKIARKMQASKEVWGKVFGAINTREKSLDHRLKLALNEWTRLKANDSPECRSATTTTRWT